ncbi:MAG: hypothetical protein AVDCRST_MAG71-1325, partial [uncultured Lysobacter sp.]
CPAAGEGDALARHCRAAHTPSSAGFQPQTTNATSPEPLPRHVIEHDVDPTVGAPMAGRHPTTD